MELPSERDDNYEAMKGAIIEKYPMTPDVYHMKFRSLQYDLQTNGMWFNSSTVFDGVQA